MSAAALRIGRWLGSVREPDACVASGESARSSAQRKLFDDVGDFLFAHGLSVSDGNFATVRAYLDGDRTVGERITALLRRGGKLTDADLTAIVDERAHPLSPERLAAMADELNGRLVECLRIIGQSSVLAREYGTALDGEVRAFEGDPLGTFERLLDLTRTVAAGANDLDARLEDARKETQRLRSHLTQARREADYDHLTGLLNRRSFESRIAALPLDPANRARMCIALCDIDRFKTVNDEHGHDAGDRVLRHFARRLRDSLGSAAVIARYGGEEFVCLFEDSSVDEAVDRLETIRTAFASKPLVNRNTGQRMPPLTFSAGIAAIDAAPRDALSMADLALYEAKRTGRNRLVVRRPPIAA